MTEPIKEHFVYRNNLRSIFRPSPDTVKGKLSAIPVEKVCHMIGHILVPAAPLVQAPLACRRDHKKLCYLHAGKCRQIILPLAHRHLKLGKGLFPFFLPCVFFPDIPLRFCQFLRMYKANPPLFGDNSAGKRLPIPIRYLSVFFQNKGILKRSILIASPMMHSIIKFASL